MPICSRISCSSERSPPPSLMVLQVGFWTSNICANCELARGAESQAPPFCIPRSGGGAGSLGGNEPSEQGTRCPGLSRSPFLTPSPWRAPSRGLAENSPGCGCTAAFALQDSCRPSTLYVASRSRQVASVRCAGVATFGLKATTTQRGVRAITTALTPTALRVAAARELRRARPRDTSSKPRTRPRQGFCASDVASGETEDRREVSRTLRPRSWRQDARLGRPNVANGPAPPNVPAGCRGRRSDRSRSRHRCTRIPGENPSATAVQRDQRRATWRKCHLRRDLMGE